MTLAHFTHAAVNPILFIALIILSAYVARNIACNREGRSGAHMMTELFVAVCLGLGATFYACCGFEGRRLHDISGPLTATLYAFSLVLFIDVARYSSRQAWTPPLRIASFSIPRIITLAIAIVLFAHWSDSTARAAGLSHSYPAHVQWLAILGVFMISAFALPLYTIMIVIPYEYRHAIASSISCLIWALLLEYGVSLLLPKPRARTS